MKPNLSKWNNKFKIFFIIVLALLITFGLSEFVFFRNTTQINPKAFLQIVTLLKNFQKAPERTVTPDMDIPTLYPSKVPGASSPIPTAPLLPTASPKAADNLAFLPIGTGISRATDTSTGNKYIKIEAGTVVEVTEYTLVDGRRIQVIKPIN